MDEEAHESPEAKSSEAPRLRVKFSEEDTKIKCLPAGRDPRSLPTYSYYKNKFHGTKLVQVGKNTNYDMLYNLGLAVAEDMKMCNADLGSSLKLNLSLLGIREANRCAYDLFRWKQVERTPGGKHRKSPANEGIFFHCEEIMLDPAVQYMKNFVEPEWKQRCRAVFKFISSADHQASEKLFVLAIFAMFGEPPVSINDLHNHIKFIHLCALPLFAVYEFSIHPDDNDFFKKDMELTFDDKLEKRALHFYATWQIKDVAAVQAQFADFQPELEIEMDVLKDLFLYSNHDNIEHFKKVMQFFVSRSNDAIGADDLLPQLPLRFTPKPKKDNAKKDKPAKKVSKKHNEDNEDDDDHGSEKSDDETYHGSGKSGGAKKARGGEKARGRGKADRGVKARGGGKAGEGSERILRDRNRKTNNSNDDDLVKNDSASRSSRRRQSPLMNPNSPKKSKVHPVEEEYYLRFFPVQLAPNEKVMQEVIPFLKTPVAERTPEDKDRIFKVLKEVGSDIFNQHIGSLGSNFNAASYVCMEFYTDRYGYFHFLVNNVIAKDAQVFEVKLSSTTIKPFKNMEIILKFLEIPLEDRTDLVENKKFTELINLSQTRQALINRVDKDATFLDAWETAEVKQKAPAFFLQFVYLNDDYRPRKNDVKLVVMRNEEECFDYDVDDIILPFLAMPFGVRKDVKKDDIVQSVREVGLDFLEKLFTVNQAEYDAVKDSYLQEDEDNGFIKFLIRSVRIVDLHADKTFLIDSMDNPGPHHELIVFLKSDIKERKKRPDYDSMKDLIMISEKKAIEEILGECKDEDYQAFKQCTIMADPDYGFCNFLIERVQIKTEPHAFKLKWKTYDGQTLILKGDFKDVICKLPKDRDDADKKKLSDAIIASGNEEIAKCFDLDELENGEKEDFLRLMKILDNDEPENGFNNFFFIYVHAVE